MTAVKYDAMTFEYQPVTYWECPKGDARVVCHVPVPPAVSALLEVGGGPPLGAYYLRFLPVETLEDAEAKVEQHEATHMRSAA